MRHVLRFLATLLLGVAIGIFSLSADYTASAQTTAPQGTEADIAYKVGAGDKLHITVFGEDNLSGDFDIDGGGNLSFPLIGTVKVGGMTLPQVETALAQRLSPNYLKNPRLSIQVLNYRPFYILGEVKNPGSYPYVNGMTALNAVALAGGFTPRGRDDKLLVIRANDPQRKEVPVAVDTPVYPGDILRVAERFF